MGVNDIVINVLYDIPLVFFGENSDYSRISNASMRDLDAMHTNKKMGLFYMIYLHVMQSKCCVSVAWLNFVFELNTYILSVQVYRRRCRQPQ